MDPALRIAAVTLLAAGAVLGPGPATAVPAAVAGSEPLAVERHVLSNGLIVLTHEDHSVPTITLWQWYRVGSRNESPGITGISHFFEHMMFNGSKNVPPKEYDKILESNAGYSPTTTSPACSTSSSTPPRSTRRPTAGRSWGGWAT